MPESIGISGFQEKENQRKRSPFWAINAAIDALVLKPTGPVVASVSEITSVDVTVAFTVPVTEEFAKATTLTFVKDAVEYTATATLVKDSTTATFVWATPLTEDGVYTLKGTAVTATLTEFAEQAAIDAVNAARNTTQVKVLTALQNPLFKNVLAANAAQYDAALTAITALVDRDTITEIQKSVIDEPNAVKAIAAAVTANSQIDLDIALTAAEEAGVITDYNPELIANYVADLVGQTANITAIQTQVTATNAANAAALEAIQAATVLVTEVEGLIAEAGTYDATELAPVNVKITAANTAVNALAASTAKTDLQARMAKVGAIQTAITNVIASEADITNAPNKNTAQLNVYQLPDSAAKTALQARIDAYAPVVDLNTAIGVSVAAVEAELLDQNTAGFAALTAANRTAAATVIQTAGAQTTVTASNDIVENAITNQTLVQKVAQATTKAALLTALQQGTTTMLADGTTPLLTNVLDANADVYKAVYDGYTPITGAPVAAAVKATVANIQANIVTAANTLVTDATTAVDTFETAGLADAAALNVAATTKANSPAALTADANFATAQTDVVALPNTLELGKELYATIHVLATEESLNGFVAEVAADKVALLAAGTVKTDLETRLAVVEDVTDVNAAASAAAVKTLLDTQLPAGYEVLSSALRLKFATFVYNTGTNYTTVAAFETALEDAALIQAVNNASTPGAVLDPLTTVALTAVASADFVNSTSDSKLEIATLFLNDDVFTATGIAAAARTSVDADEDYTTIANIKTDLNKIALAHKNLLAGVSTAATNTKTITAMDTELAKLVDFGYTGYDDLAPAVKLQVAEKFLALYPVDADGVQIANSYKSVGAITAAVEAAIAAL